MFVATIFKNQFRNIHDKNTHVYRKCVLLHMGGWRKDTKAYAIDLSKLANGEHSDCCLDVFGSGENYPECQTDDAKWRQ